MKFYQNSNPKVPLDLNSYLNDIKKNYVSNELFPSHLKIIDPIEVTCEKCGISYIESESFVKKLKVENKNPICENCRASFNKPISQNRSKEINKLLIKTANQKATSNTIPYSNKAQKIKQNPQANPPNYQKININIPKQTINKPTKKRRTLGEMILQFFKEF